MRLVVLGAAGGVGRQVVAVAHERGHQVTAVARKADAGKGDAGNGDDARWIAADVRDTAAVNPLLRGADAVVWCVGVTARSGGEIGRTALPPLLAAMSEHGVPRFVGISGAGADLPGDHKGFGARLISGLTHRLAPRLVADKEDEYHALAASDLDWTQVRPPRLADTAGTGRYLLTEDAPGLRARPVARADVARAMLDLTETRQWLGAAPFVLAV